MKAIRKVLLLILLLTHFNAFALFDQCKGLFPEEQIPTSPKAGRDLCFDGFAIYYSPQDKKPIYTIEKLNQKQFLAPHPRRTNQFYEEARLPYAERAQLSDYRGSGYDRGHNVPAGDMSNDQSMAQSFSLANMMPQARQNNQGIWSKNVEEPTRQYVKRTSGDVYVYTGSVGKAGTIGNGRVTIPTHLFKLVYDPNKNSAWAYWVENTNEATMSPPITYEELEQKTGIHFRLPLKPQASSTPQETKNTKPQAKPVGAWYPIFFDDESPNKMSNLISQIQEGRVASVQIQYDRNRDLAQKLRAQIQTKTQMQAEIIQSSPPDSSGVQYEHHRVTAIVYLQ